MSVKQYMKCIIYRVASKGLEVFLVKEDKNNWMLPSLDSDIDLSLASKDVNIIQLDDLTDDSQDCIPAHAVEADYHDIPSLRALIKEDVMDVKEKLENLVPDLDRGSFVAFKEAFKNMLPAEYKALKELKEIIADRNQIINL